MNGDDKRNAVVEFGEDAAEMGIPRVAMHDVGINIDGVEIQAALHRPKHRI